MGSWKEAEVLDRVSGSESLKTGQKRYQQILEVRTAEEAPRIVAVIKWILGDDYVFCG